MKLSRRQFLAAGGAGLLAWSQKDLSLAVLKPVTDVENPLEFYPNRGWEKVYRDQYRVDGSFTWVCSPNCTHECRLRAFTRNGVVLRTEQNYDNQRISDLYGNRATHHWNPRACANGFTFQRRMYGPYRLRYPMVRRGWKRWADDGFPELNEANKKKYMFDARGSDTFVRVSWDDVYTYAAKGFIQVAKTYSGEAGKRRLVAQGHSPEMFTHWDGAGTRTIKFRGGMGLLGVIGKYGMYRFANTMALVDSHVRGVEPKKARGGRAWANYTWHGDQAPGHPFVHGLQTSDCDFNDLRATKLLIAMGKNLVENKRADSHFSIEGIERGTKMIVVAPEYSPPATKADYWIPIRPQTDAALLLGVTKILIDRGWYDAEFVKGFTDFPLLVRTDTLRRLQPRDVIAGYRNQDISAGPSFLIQGLKPKQRETIGDFMVWDNTRNEAVPITRDDVGRNLAEKGIDPVLEGRFTVRTVDGKDVEVMTLFEMYKNHHLKDYDLESVHEITHCPKDLITRFAKDLATIKPAAIHVGEGINHWFHATEINR
ncbi:MAG: molybdopterin-dependent oxidoreductase, partial [Nitrospinota bacterium]|nr:molybdopterin-dependent oxidoreductase [Nitrospinota bacterium]